MDIRKLLREGVNEFQTVPTNELPTMTIAPEDKLPQVGSKFFDYDIMNQSIIFKDGKRRDGDLLDFVINDKGEFLIGGGHYKLAKKSDTTKGAGELKIDDQGKIVYINNESGHYKPQQINLDAVVKTLGKLGILNPNIEVKNLH